MRQPIPPHEWLGGSGDRITWVIDHLHTRMGLAVPYPQDRAAVLRTLEHIWQRDHGVDEFARIKRAWNAHSHKKNNNKRTFSFVLSTDVARRLKRQAKTFKMSQSGYLTSLIQGDGAHLARLKEDYASKAARSKQQRSPPSEKDESRYLSRLHSENERKSALIDQYEQLIKQLVRTKLLSEELHSCGLEDKAELDDGRKIALWARVEDQTSEHLESARQQAVDPAYQAPNDPPHRP